MAKLTAKQRRAIRRAPKRRRAAVARNFRGGGYGASALRGIKQGVGKTAPQAFGSLMTTKYHPCMHDAFHMAHLPLPRPTGPYCVIRTTQQEQMGGALTILGPIYNISNGTWDRQFAVSSVDENATIGASNNAQGFVFDQLKTAAWTGVQLTPSAFSVQIMNPGALQSTTGIVYLGRIRTALQYTTPTSLAQTWKALANFLISYNNPRLCSAAKLAFRGVQIDLVPFNMSHLADFTPPTGGDNAAYTPTNNTPDFGGFAPMFIWNPSKINLNVLVCCEWRVRFDPSNPAQAAHVQHPHATETTWSRVMHGAEAIGNGVVDIAERVADTGNALYGAMASGYRVGRGMRAIAGAGQLALGV